MEPFETRPLEFLRQHGREFPPWSLGRSQDYCLRLAREHYENFLVVSPLVPRNLRQDYRNVYAYCRWADDLGDETGDPARSVELLGWWRSQLLSMQSQPPAHPVFVALAETVRRHDLPVRDFDDLLSAFLLDQTKRAYADHRELLEYCELSANPVGRIVLRLHGCTDGALLSLSDDICSALQLANHWQDVRRDWSIGRVYIPEAVMRRHGYGRERLGRDIRRGLASPEFRSTLEDLTRRAALLFERGRPLGAALGGRLGRQVELFADAGCAVLEKIRSQGYDTIAKRPVIGWRDVVRLLAGALVPRGLRQPASGRGTRNAVA